MSPGISDFQNRSTIYFLQPELDQALSILDSIRRNSKNVKVIAVVSRSSFLTKSRVGRYDGIVHIDDLSDDFLLSGNVFPMGAWSTEFILEKGSVKYGSLTFSSNNLCVFNKNKFLKLCSDCGILIPQQRCGWRQFKDMSFPVFYKASHEVGGGERGVAFTSSELPNNGESTFIYQEYIESEGTYGVSFIAEQGKLVTSLCHWEIMSAPPAGGSAVIIEEIEDIELVRLTSILVEKIGYSGWGLAEFKFCPKRKKYVVMEINSKFWASCELALSRNTKFLDIIFGIECEVSNYSRLFFVNRALEVGLLKSFYALYKYSDSKFIIYPGLVRSFLKGIFPDWLLVFLAKIMRRGRFGKS